jgi:disulfide bond formation protein DsbB
MYFYIYTIKLIIIKIKINIVLYIYIFSLSLSVYVEFIEVVWQGMAVKCDTTPQAQGKLAPMIWATSARVKSRKAGHQYSYMIPANRTC